MIRTYGLTHISLEVADPEVSLQFYERMFGVKAYFRDDDSIQVLGPGEKDVIAFVRSERAGAAGGINHFGFRLRAPEDIETAIRTAREAGARILRSGEFAPGYPYLYVSDPDGYQIEIWYE